MDFNAISEKLETSVVEVPIESPSGMHFFAYESPKDGWNLTDEPKIAELDLKVKCHPVIIKVVGADHPSFKSAVAKVQKEIQKRPQKNQDPTEAEKVMLLASAVVGWDYLVWGVDGCESKPLEFTPANAKMVIGRYTPLAEQLNLFISNRENFT